MNACGTCELCGRVCWLYDVLDERWVHPCCVTWIEHFGEARCQACDIAESERRKWERRHREAV